MIEDLRESFLIQLEQDLEQIFYIAKGSIKEIVEHVFWLDITVLQL